MKRFLVLWSVLLALAVLVVAAPVGVNAGDQPKDRKEPGDEEKASIWMKKKLEYSQNIMAGLTKGDFDTIALNAHKMEFLGYLEKWAKADTRGYKEQVVFFDFANKELIRQAKEKNLDGATLAYNQLTVSCVQCHKIVRGAMK